MIRNLAFIHAALLILLTVSTHAADGEAGSYSAWGRSGTFFILTTSEGADLPAGASVKEFPLLLRLHRDFFDFTQAKALGADIRFSDAGGNPLAYQIEEWDVANGRAAIWVRIPSIQGQARQAIRMHWGKLDAASESNGASVFNASNGYLSVWHMSDPVTDAAGTLSSKDTGTLPAAGLVGPARRFPGGHGIFCGDAIASFPLGSEPHSSEAWFRAEISNSTLLGWGEEKNRGGKVRMQLRSPPHLYIDSFFENVVGTRRLASATWTHVVHTFGPDGGMVYINGELDGAAKPKLNLPRPARMWIGGWYNTYDFVGELDEVRVSRVARSAEWVKLQYENQKPLQTLIGHLVQSGNAFSVSAKNVEVAEGRKTSLTADVNGAQKIYWIHDAGTGPRVVSVDRRTFEFDAGRVTGDTTVTLQCKAVYPDSTRTQDLSIRIKESIADPVVALAAPAEWDGRRTIEVVPTITNLAEMQAQGAPAPTYDWSISGLAVTKEVASGKLILTRAQNSGALRVRVSVSNGGTTTVRDVVIQVKEPERDAWVSRAPRSDEQPEDHQFYPRDDKNEGTLIYNGVLNGAADAVLLKVTADGQPYASESKTPAADGGYTFSVKLKPGLIKYKVEFGTKKGVVETTLRTVDDLVCGDTYILQGQSNAVATDWGKEEKTYSNEWIRSYGSASRDPKDIRGWGIATLRTKDNAKFQIGYWGMELGRRLVESQKIPICILNGAVGGTRIDQHLRNVAQPDDPKTIYGRLLARARQAGLTHGIRAIFWHQGENDQGADGPDGGFGYESYQRYFIELSAAWKQDYPNLQHYYIFQIWPKACAMGQDGSDNRLREVQRNLPSLFSNMSIMSTLGVHPPGGCHYPPEGYAEIARLIAPLVEKQTYGRSFDVSITPPNLIEAIVSNEQRDEILLRFNQPVTWNESLVTEFYLDGAKGKVAAGAVEGTQLRLKLTGPTSAATLGYLDGSTWKPSNILRGANGIAALTFWDVPLRGADATLPQNTKPQK